ncbi:MAG: ATP-binding protein [Thermoplasmatota archaeon]
MAASFATLSSKSVLADCDVDSTDLHLIIKPHIKRTTGFHAKKLASIDKILCTSCKTCYDFCRFHAIDEEIHVIKELCEGCGVCHYVCPNDAIKMIQRDSGLVYISDTRCGPMSHASLKTAEEASGKLITVVRNNARTIAERHKKELIIIDGPPGVGYPVFSTIIGVDLVVIVTEPTLSALQDLKRIIKASQHFNIPAVVCINKYDINLQNTEEITKYCAKNSIEVVGKIPYDTIINDAMIQEKSVVEFSDELTSRTIKDMWTKIQEKLTTQ